mmetsp:Transcript_17616/g.36715  ORF Transcript_17616/g.36715 Transcript_17616/m.36715 type:complete len:225 (-) Transcript_17616:228-902(-)
MPLCLGRTIRLVIKNDIVPSLGILVHLFQHPRNGRFRFELNIENDRRVISPVIHRRQRRILPLQQDVKPIHAITPDTGPHPPRHIQHGKKIVVPPPDLPPHLHHRRPVLLRSDFRPDLFLDLRRNVHQPRLVRPREPPHPILTHLGKLLDLLGMRIILLGIPEKISQDPRGRSGSHFEQEGRIAPDVIDGGFDVGVGEGLEGFLDAIDGESVGESVGADGDGDA